MNHRKTALATALILVAFAVAADPKEAIRTQYNAMMKAFMAKDVKSFLSLTTPDVVMIDKTGTKTTRKQIEAEYKQMMTVVKKITSATIEIRSFKASGNTAECKSLSKLEAIVPVPQMDASGKPLQKEGRTIMKDGKIRAVNESSDTWVLANGIWKLKSTKVEKSETWLNGKKVG